jgi:hypothetical protein
MGSTGKSLPLCTESSQGPGPWKPCLLPGGQRNGPGGIVVRPPPSHPVVQIHVGENNKIPDLAFYPVNSPVDKGIEPSNTGSSQSFLNTFSSSSSSLPDYRNPSSSSSVSFPSNPGSNVQPNYSSTGQNVATSFGSTGTSTATVSSNLPNYNSGQFSSQNSFSQTGVQNSNSPLQNYNSQSGVQNNNNNNIPLQNYNSQQSGIVQSGGQSNFNSGQFGNQNLPNYGNTQNSNNFVSNNNVPNFNNNQAGFNNQAVLNNQASYNGQNAGNFGGQNSGSFNSGSVLQNSFQNVQNDVLPEYNVNGYRDRFYKAPFRPKCFGTFFYLDVHSMYIFTVVYTSSKYVHSMCIFT